MDAAVEAFFEVAIDSTLSDDAVRNAWLYSADLLQTPASEGMGLGCTADEDWAESVAVLERFTDLEEGTVDVADLYTNDFLTDCG